MDFKQMISFQQVAKYKSFSKASQKLFFSQPAITNHIAELEKHLGAKLLDRTRSSVELTPFGEKFLTYVNQMVSLRNEAVETLDSMQEGKSGKLKIALTGSSGYQIFPLLEKFRASHKDIDIEVFVGLCNPIIEMVTNRAAHFGILKTDLPSYVNPLFVTQVIGIDENILVFPPSHKFSDQEELTMAEVCKEAMIAYARRTNYWDQILDVFHSLDLNPKVSMEAFDYHTIKLLLKSSLGIAFLPRACVEEELEKGTLKTLPIIDCPPIKRYAILMYRNDLHFNQLTSDFLNELTPFYIDNIELGD